MPGFTVHIKQHTQARLCCTVWMMSLWCHTMCLIGHTYDIYTIPCLLQCYVSFSVLVQQVQYTYLLYMCVGVYFVLIQLMKDILQLFFIGLLPNFFFLFPPPPPPPPPPLPPSFLLLLSPYLYLSSSISSSPLCLLPLSSSTPGIPVLWRWCAGGKGSMEDWLFRLWACHKSSGGEGKVDGVWRGGRGVYSVHCGRWQ